VSHLCAHTADTGGIPLLPSEISAGTSSTFAQCNFLQPTGCDPRLQSRAAHGSPTQPGSSSVFSTGHSVARQEPKGALSCSAGPTPTHCSTGGRNVGHMDLCRETCCRVSDSLCCFTVKSQAAFEQKVLEKQSNGQSEQICPCAHTVMSTHTPDVCPLPVHTHTCAVCPQTYTRVPPSVYTPDVHAHTRHVHADIYAHCPCTHSRYVPCLCTHTRCIHANVFMHEQQNCLHIHTHAHVHADTFRCPLSLHKLTQTCPPSMHTHTHTHAHPLSVHIHTFSHPARCPEQLCTADPRKQWHGRILPSHRHTESLWCTCTQSDVTSATTSLHRHRFFHIKT